MAKKGDENCDNDLPFELAEELSMHTPPGQQNDPLFTIDDHLYHNKTGEPQLLECKESCCDYGLQNMITCQQVKELVSTRAANFMIIDCRSKYEYDGGHIKGAINISEPEDLKAFLCPSATHVKQLMETQTIIIFHCEYSERRAPSMYFSLRQFDRHYNIEKYPRLFFPEIYVMQGGYSKYWQLFEPSSGYVKETESQMFKY